MAGADERLRQFARKMRRAPTRAEERLWAWLRNRRFRGCKFRRQVPVGSFILDFYCSELRLAIELDGSHHRQSWRSDYELKRRLVLEKREIYVLAIPNELLIRDSRLVAEMIDAAIDARLTAISHGSDRGPAGE